MLLTIGTREKVLYAEGTIEDIQKAFLRNHRFNDA
jgi:hypothetical protein